MCQPAVTVERTGPSPCAARRGRRILSCSNSAFTCAGQRCQKLPRRAQRSWGGSLHVWKQSGCEVPCCSQPKVFQSCHPTPQCCCFYPKCAQQRAASEKSPAVSPVWREHRSFLSSASSKHIRAARRKGKVQQSLTGTCSGHFSSVILGGFVCCWLCTSHMLKCQ